MAENNKKNEPQDRSRRSFLKYSGTAIGGVVVGGVIGGIIGNTMGNRSAEPSAPQTPETKPAENVQYNHALMFFTQEQFQLTQAAAERIFPKDDLGPGAIELGVGYFIDHQMASPYGMNAKDYMKGPFSKGEPTQGNFPSITRNELITLGLKSLKEYSAKKYGKAFTELSEAEQDEVLASFEKGEEVVLLNGNTTTAFFNQLRSLTIEGVYSDPLYGGNKDMMGWKMRNYPGNQMSYTAIIDKDEFVKIEPSSLHQHMQAH